MWGLSSPRPSTGLLAGSARRSEHVRDIAVAVTASATPLFGDAAPVTARILVIAVVVGGDPTALKCQHKRIGKVGAADAALLCVRLALDLELAARCVGGT
jgi:hypothetical protein